MIQIIPKNRLKTPRNTINKVNNVTPNGLCVSVADGEIGGSGGGLVEGMGEIGVTFPPTVWTISRVKGNLISTVRTIPKITQIYLHPKRNLLHLRWALNYLASKFYANRAFTIRFLTELK
jgi:hypothetical protein